ncbi:conserved hypothetical protein [Frankia sp. AiPs1]|uniref:hypothetical protein n=1 Tax=Frankia sp. AiPa1 TaxID=573492 RepID=UPI00202B7764|nr:hypothetical protein [Frankia sp. AiPa1]MCL9762087.1 hypothetical protein [Frankia sp. AiPa1]
MADAAAGPDAGQLWAALRDALNGSWQGRAVLAQLRSDRAGGLSSLRALLADAPPPPVAALIAWYGADNLIQAAHTAHARRRPRGLLIGAGVVVLVTAVIVAVTLSTGGAKDPAVSATNGRRPVSASARPGPGSVGGTATATPSSRAPVGTGPVVGDLADPTVSDTATRRLGNATWVPFSLQGFSYRARAVMIHTLAVAGNSAPPAHHKLVFLTEILNVQTDRPAPQPVAVGAEIDVARTLVSDASGGCDDPFHSLAAGGDDQCAMGVLQVDAQTYLGDKQIPAGGSAYVLLGALENVPDAVADSQVALYLSDDRGHDITSVRVPLG